MKKWLRWQGLVAFLLIAGGMVAFFYLFAGRLIKSSIETAGTKAVGARVELAQANLSLFPLGLELEGLKVTDPENPMKNAVEIGLATLSFETGGLMLRKIIVKEMTVGDILFNTPRKKSGAIKGLEKREVEKKTEERGKKEWKLPSLDMEDVKSILEKETLATLVEAKKLQADIKSSRKYYQKELKSLPDRNKFETYRHRIETLKSEKRGIKAILGGVGEAKSLKDEIASDINQIKKTQQELKKRVSDLNARISRLARAPLEDYTRLKKKYALSPQGLGNLSGVIFGPQYSDWVRKGLTWYMKIKPMLEKKKEEKEDEEAHGIPPLRDKGITVAFREKRPAPGFLIKKADASVHIPAGDIAGTINNITDEQNIMGLPLTCRFSGNRLKGVESVVIKGILNRVRPEKAMDHATVSVKGFQLEKVELGENSDLDITLEKGLADFDLETAIEGDRIDSTVKLALTSVQFSPNNSSRIAHALSDALADVTTFSIHTKITGTLDNYDIQLASDLDPVMKKAISHLTNELSAKFGENLKKAIEEKTGGEINALKQQMGDFVSLDNELAKRLQLGNQTLNLKLF